MKYLLIFLCLFSSAVISDVYKWKDASGKVHYGDNPSKDQPVEKITLEINSYEHVTITEVPTSTATSTPAAANTKKHVIIYSTTWCGYCKKAKSYFQANHISFTDYDIEKDAAAKTRYDALGGRGVPVILVGNKRMNGFSIDGFLNIYN